MNNIIDGLEMLIQQCTENDIMIDSFEETIEKRQATIETLENENEVLKNTNEFLFKETKDYVKEISTLLDDIKELETKLSHGIIIEKDLGEIK